MAYDVFVSYSRKDIREALELAEWLQSEGLSVWIDRHGIVGAKQWAAEIAKTIRESSTLLLLISENIARSANVLKEVTLAAERGKPILPIILRRAAMPDSIEYHLAGIHYLHYADHSSILSALKGQVPLGKSRAILDKRKSIMVLPFDDLSPGKDNGWFADGLTGELISMLSKIKSLRVIDRNTSMEFRQARGRTTEVARELSVRYFLEGNVRKFENQIKISMELLDVETGNYILHESQKGVFADIFGIQEAVAQKVVEGLDITLVDEESKGVGIVGTTNSDAYELYLRASDYFYSWTHQGMLRSIELVSAAIAIDRNYTEALLRKAIALLNIYRLWDRNPKYLDEAESLFLLEHKLSRSILLRSELVLLYILKRDYKKAESIATQNLTAAPDDFSKHFWLGYFYYNTGEIEKAIEPYEEAIRLDPKDRLCFWNLTEALDRLELEDKRKYYSLRALPLFERWLLLHAEDQFTRAQLATFQLYAGEKEKALKTVEPLVVATDVDGLALYTVAVMYMHLNDSAMALQILDRAVTAGFSHIELLKSDPNFAPVATRPEYLRLLDRMEKVLE